MWCFLCKVRPHVLFIARIRWELLKAVPWIRQFPASNRGGLGSISVQYIWDLWWTGWRWNKFPPPPTRTSIFPWQYHSTCAPFKSAHKCCFYLTEKREKPGNLSKPNSVSGFLGGGALDRKVISLGLLTLSKWYTSEVDWFISLWLQHTLWISGTWYWIVALCRMYVYLAAEKGLCSLKLAIKDVTIKVFVTY